MSIEQRDAPQMPRTVASNQELYRLLLQRLKEVAFLLLKTPPKPYELNEAHQSKEALRLWAKNVGVEIGVMEILDSVGGPLRNEMFEDLWQLHDTMEEIEVMVGSRPSRTDEQRARTDAFQYFNRILYTLTQKAEMFNDLAASYCQYRTSASTLTSPPSDRRNPLERFNGSPVPAITRPENTDRIAREVLNQTHLRNDSHSANIKKEEPNPLQRDYSVMSGPLPAHDARLRRTDLQVKIEDTETNHSRHGDLTPSTSSVSMSPNISQPAHLFSPTGSSPLAVEPWSPQTPANSSLLYPSSSIEERKKMYDEWALTALHRDGQPMVVHARILPDPASLPVSQHGSVGNGFPPILPRPGSSSLATTTPRTGFYSSSYHQSPRWSDS